MKRILWIVPLVLFLLSACSPSASPTVISPTSVIPPTPIITITSTTTEEIELFPYSDFPSVNYDSTLWELVEFNPQDNLPENKILLHKMITGCSLSPWYGDFGTPPQLSERVTVGERDFNFGELINNDKSYYMYAAVSIQIQTITTVTPITVVVPKEASERCMMDAKDIIATLH